MTDDERRLLGAWLRAQRRQRNATAEAIAKLLGVDKSLVCNVERGVGLPRLARFARWLAIFGVDLLAALRVRK